MSNKDSQNLSSIYQKIINEVKIGSNEPLQHLGSGIPYSGPASTVVAKIPKKKKKRKKIVENVFGSFLQGIEMAKKGQLPFDFKKTEKPSTSEKKEIIGKENRPKINQKVINAKNPEITGVVMTDLNNKGQFGIKILNFDEKNPKKFLVSNYLFVKTVKKPYWHLEQNDVIDRNHISGKDEILKQKNKEGEMVKQFSPSEDIPYVMVGRGTRYENWYDWKNYFQN